MSEETQDLWPAPHATGPVRATVSLPGSKSLTNRALVLAALSDGPSVVRRALRSRDTELMADALNALGTGIARDGEDWKVTPGPFRGGATVDCGLAGTVMRFVPPVAALADGPDQARRHVPAVGVAVVDDHAVQPQLLDGHVDVRQ